MNNIGEIIKIKNFIFKGNTLDHSKIRPCVIIYKTDTLIYVLPISSSKEKNKYANYKVPEQYINVNKEKYINLTNIYTYPNCKYQKQRCFDKKILLDILNHFYFYQINIKPDKKFKEIKSKILIKNN